MVYVRDGLGMSNENGTLGSALASYLRRRSKRIRVSGIDHVNIAVRDLERSLQFYHDVFGFNLVDDGRWREPPYFILSAGGRALLALHETPETTVPDRPFINHWGFVVGDLDEVRRKVAEWGLDIAEPPGVDDRGMVHWAHSRSMYVFDPDGHEIELAETFGGGLPTA